MYLRGSWEGLKGSWKSCQLEGAGRASERAVSAKVIFMSQLTNSEKFNSRISFIRIKAVEIVCFLSGVPKA